VRDAAGDGTGEGFGVGSDLGNRLGTGVGRQDVGKGASASREVGSREATGGGAGLGTGGVIVNHSRSVTKLNNITHFIERCYE
jgi:hypothetical protein